MNNEERVKELAAKVLNGFSFTEMKPEYLTVIDYSEISGFFDYILVGDGKQEYELILKISKNRMSWEVEFR